MFTKILIANRGEIACRIIKTCKKMGIQTVAVYSTADKNSLHVQQADSAFCIGDAPAKASYLNIPALIAVAERSKAEAIHPGYGFLSENASFAEACQAAGIVFIGPSVEALKLMGSKQLAKQHLEKTQVPLTPGYHGELQTDDQLLLEAHKIGFPILLKAANGGGGKGMRAVYEADDFFKALASARRESEASFADDTMLIEKLISNPRHVEVQIMADNHGQVVHLFERDCSIQRRHQKIIEEAPAPRLAEALKAKLLEAACEVARSINYSGAGTVEFLVDGEEHFYFMEMNTRLQVEHPVTEMISNLDLVAWQIKIAANYPLPLTQDAIKARGHAIECRLYSEDPYVDFLPSTGKVHFLQEPQGEGLRIDSGIEVNSLVSNYYDPMIAKIICWGENREEALKRMQQALGAYAIGGLKTNLPFLQALCEHPRFIKAELSTNFLQQETLILKKPSLELALLMAASFDYLKLTEGKLKDHIGWQMHLSSYWFWRYEVSGDIHEVQIKPLDASSFQLELEGKSFKLHPHLSKDRLVIEWDGQIKRAFYENIKNTIHFYFNEGVITLERFSYRGKTSTLHKKEQLTAPMPSTVVAILKEKAELVKKGEPLIILEAMKMEHTIYAPYDGILMEFYCELGSQVNEGMELVALKENNGISPSGNNS